jgi:hypothetical protein
MPAHARRREAEPVPDGSGGDRSFLQQQLDDGRSGMPFAADRRGRSNRPGTGPATSPFVVPPQTHGFHNISVAEFVPEI